MINGILQACGFILTLIGWVMAVITCALPLWRKQYVDGEDTEAIIRTAGLWIRCVYQPTGTGYWTCSDYDIFFLGLPKYLEVCRVTSCLSIAFGFIGVILAPVGLDCTRMVSHKPTTKVILAIIAGTFHVIAGASLGGSVTRFAVMGLKDDGGPIQSVAGGLRFVFGKAIYIGCAGSGISVIGGIIMILSSRSLLLQSRHYHQPKSKVVSEETNI